MQRTTFFTFLLLLTTCIHHIYGAIIYNTPWRLHVIFFAVPVMIAVWVLGYFYTRNPGRILWVSYLLAVLLFPVLMIGLYEGVYNHLIKNIVFPFTGNSSFFKLLFPPPAYEAPNDLLFELTGILQALILYPLIRHFRKLVAF
jgi:hypothetical protein